MLAPFDTGRLIELEFVFQIFTYARHDQRVRIAGDDLCESPHTRAAPSVARQQRRIGMRLVKIFDDRQRLEQDRSFAVGQNGSKAFASAGSHGTATGRSLEFDTVAFRILRVDRRALAFGTLASHLRTAGGALPGKMFC
jgi:hypothetical protein